MFGKKKKINNDIRYSLLLKYVTGEVRQFNPGIQEDEGEVVKIGKKSFTDKMFSRGRRTKVTPKPEWMGYQRYPERGAGVEWINGYGISEYELYFNSIPVDNFDYSSMEERVFIKQGSMSEEVFVVGRISNLDKRDPLYLFDTRNMIAKRMPLVESRIKDPNIIRLVRRMLKAGVMKNYQYEATEEGWTIIEVTDPANPRFVKFFECCDPNEYKAQCTPKIQVANGLMIAAIGGGVQFLHGFEDGAKAICGLQIYDIKTDPENPKLLSFWETGTTEMGVHRFAYNGGNYVYMPAECPGFVGFIVRILDISDPSDPKECGRWWMPEQFKDGMMPGTYPVGHQAEKDWPMCHACTIRPDKPDELYMGYFGGGGILLDISDPTRPRLKGRIKMQPPFAGKNCGARCHTFLPLTGRNFAVLTNEGERFPLFTKEVIENGIHPGAQPMNNLHMIDVSDPTDPTLVAEFPYPEVPENFPYPNFNDCGIGCQGPFGPHNVHEPMGKSWLQDDPNLVYCCYFHAGLRIYDVTDPYVPKEIAYFIPPNPEKQLFGPKLKGPFIATTEDVVVDDRGYIYIDTFHDGMYILRRK